MITAPGNAKNDTNGNGKYTPLRKSKKKESLPEEKEFVYLDKIDLRMRFNNSKDPIYFAFEYLEKRSVTELAIDFVKDSFFDVTKFVSKIVR